MTRARLPAPGAGSIIGADPVWPAVLPIAGDGRPPRSCAVDADSGGTPSGEGVVFALQAVAVLDRVVVPGVVRLDVEPPHAAGNSDRGRRVVGGQASVVSVVVGQAVGILELACVGAGGVQMGGVVVPAGVGIQAQRLREVSRLGGKAWI